MGLRKGCVSSKLIVAVNRNFEIIEFDVISIMGKNRTYLLLEFVISNFDVAMQKLRDL